MEMYGTRQLSSVSQSLDKASQYILQVSLYGRGPAGQNTCRDAVCHRDPAFDQHADIESLLHGVERLVPEDGPACAILAL